MAEKKPYDEKQVLELLSTGSQTAFVQLYDQYRPFIYNTSLKLVKSHELAKEVLQEVFMDVWNRRETINRVVSIKSYLYGMTRNIVFDHLKEKANMLAISREFAYGMKHENSTEKAMLDKQYEELLNEAVNQLPPQQKLVFRLAKVEGLSHEAIAKQLSLSRLTVKAHMKQALQSIRLRLEGHLGSYAFLAVIIRIFES